MNFIKGVNMTRQQIIDNLKDEERRAIAMGCTHDYIETLREAQEEIEKLQHIDALVSDSVFNGDDLADQIRGFLK